MSVPRHLFRTPRCLTASTMFLYLLRATISAAVASPKHAVVFLVDDLGYGDTAHMGAEFPTKSIDALAMAGIRLNQSYVTMLCSPTRSALLSSRYSFEIGMDGSVLISGDARCINASSTTLGDQMSRNGVKTAFLGKYDVGYSSWHCTPNCRGWDYWLGYYGAAEDYYQHGSESSLDFHENFAQAPQYRGEYSTDLLARKAIEWITNETVAASTTASMPSTLLYFASQAVHGPISDPPQIAAYDAACSAITSQTRRTYCKMMQALDAAIGNVTNAYKSLGLFDDTVFLFLSDNGGTNQDGGFNVPLRGQKATVWEGGVRSQTFLSWTGFDAARVGTIYSGLAHATDWGVTILAALGHTWAVNEGERAADGLNLWPALTSGGASPRTEMLLQMRDRTECPDHLPSCVYRGQLAYRRGKYKLIYGHPALRGGQGDGCAWSNNSKTGAPELNCWNGWGVPFERGASRPPTPILVRERECCCRPQSSSLSHAFPQSLIPPRSPPRRRRGPPTRPPTPGELRYSSTSRAILSRSTTSAHRCRRSSSS